MPPALAPRDELRLLRRARWARAALLADAAGASTTFERRVAHEAALRATAGRALLCLRLHEVVRRVCARARPRAIITTWEGHGWERLAFHAARSVAPNVLCIGYQHAIVFPRAHALKRPLGKMYDPDAVLTVGDVTHEIMRKAGGMPDTRLVVYGSHRRAPEARLRAGDASLRCLVIPEGLEQECLVLFDFALSAAAHMPCTTFVLRTHPVLPFAALEARHPRLRKLPRNVQVSGEKDIGADFARCDWALYRGSSAAVHAVLAGVRPLYVEREGELPIDPLFPMQGWRRHVGTPLGLQELIRADMAMSAQLRREEWESAREFCNRYMVPPDFDVIWRLLGE